MPYTVEIESAERRNANRELAPTFLVCVYRTEEGSSDRTRVYTIDNTTNRAQAEEWSNEQRDFYCASGHQTDHFHVYRLGNRIFLQIVRQDGRSYVPYRFLHGWPALQENDLRLFERKLQQFGLEKYEDEYTGKEASERKWYRLCGKYRRVS